MKKNGFTVVELLAVFIILSIIFVISVPLMTEILKQSKDTLYKKQINTILDGSYDYSLKYINYLPEKGSTSYITLGELKYEGMVEYDLTDPETNEKFSDNLVISIKNVGTNYKNKDVYAKLEGDYLYKVEINKLNDSKPSIILIGKEYDKALQKDGNYLVSYDLNHKMKEIEYSAFSSDEDRIDLTDRVKKYILLNGEPTNSIATNVPAIYKIYYSVVDDNGYANTVVLSIIIKDDKIPEIKFPPPHKNEISKNTTTFDYLDGVECKDNSGYCDIDFTGEISFGVPGKYVITYIARDPSGNTATKKRTITVKK